MAAPDHRGAFRYDGLHMGVTSPSKAHLRWLEAFLLPHFLPADDSPRNVEVSLKADRDLFLEHRDDLREARPAPAFMFNARVVSLPCREGGDGSRRLWDERLRTVYEVSADRRGVNIIVGEDRPEARAALLGVIREYAMNEARSRGGFFLHASSFNFGGRTVIVAGPTAAGKSTLLIFACLGEGVGYLGNDRVRIEGEQGSVRLGSMPVPIYLRRGTFHFFPEIGRRVEEEALDYLLLPGEETGEGRAPLLPVAHGRRGLSPEQFSDLVGAPRAAGGSDPVLVFPRFTHRRGTSVIRKLSAGEAFHLLQESLFGGRHWAETTPVFNVSPPGGDRGGIPLAEQCRAFLAETPCLLCEVGRDLYHGPGGSGPWIRSLFRGAGLS